MEYVDSSVSLSYLHIHSLSGIPRNR